jgi:uncharacterized protein (DUF2235 family)
VPKNIVIYSDGTGQRGGLLFDERRSNIYKLYRATRCGPDSCISPADQLTFYDPGLGTLPPGSGLPWLGRWFYNLASQATGLGLTGNIIDCYAAIIRMWEPGDKIFLFGFSRGAYTVRCLAGVLSLCGVPSSGDLKRDMATSKKIASEGVKRVYQHTYSIKRSKADKREIELLEQRDALARQFRAKYQSFNPESPEQSSAFPYFIGVFDTVASLANPVAVMGLSILLLAAYAAASAVVGYWFGFQWSSFIIVAFVLLAVAWGVTLIKRIRVVFDLPGYDWRKTFHLTQPRMKFYDHDLNINVGFARHAIAIDEDRASFDRVWWGDQEKEKDTEPPWFEQVWFAGDHSDIGGSYPENESRLSDITLSWMLEAANSVGLKYDVSLLQLYPDFAGMQHDEMKSGLFGYFGRKRRDPPKDAPLHETVLNRFALDSVLQYDVRAPYRPYCLRNHETLGAYTFVEPPMTHADKFWAFVEQVEASIESIIRRKKLIHHEPS